MRPERSLRHRLGSGVGHWSVAGGLFEHDLPPGFHYHASFITENDERVAANCRPAAVVAGAATFHAGLAEGIQQRRRPAEGRPALVADAHCQNAKAEPSIL